MTIQNNVMALYMDREDFALFGSKNLKEWQQLSDVKSAGSSECPDFFPLAVDQK
jgi:levanase/fructan beta-fructosidase